MPGFDSGEALSLLKESGLQAAFILVTGTMPEQHALEYITMGADDYILKSNLARLPVAVNKAYAQKVMQKEKQLAEERLREKEMLISLLSKSLPVVSYIVEVGTFRVKYISNNVKEVTGFEDEFFLTNPGFWRSRLHPDDRNMVNDSAELERKNDRYYRWKVHNGKYKWFHDRTTLIEKNGIYYSIGVWIDITEQKEIQLKLIEKIRDLDTYLYHTSHSLRSPIASIKGLLNLSRGLVSDPNIETILEMVGRCNSNMETILANLTQLSETAALPVKYEPIKLRTEINSIIQQFSHLPNIRFDMSISQRARAFSFDKRILKSILAELIKNSINYRRTHCETIVSITAKVIDSSIEIRMRDNGQGILPEVKQRVFEMFYRANDSSPGIGMGLYIVRISVEKVNGTIVIDSVPDSYTEVVVTLPIAFGNRKKSAASAEGLLQPLG